MNLREMKMIANDSKGVSKCAAIALALAFLLMVPQKVYAQVTLTGRWESQSTPGLIYEISQNNVEIYAIYGTVPPGHAVEPGELAFRGDLLGSVIRAQFFARFSREIERRCPNKQKDSTAIYFSVVDLGNTIRGYQMQEHIPDNRCEADDRRLFEIVLRRVR